MYVFRKRVNNIYFLIYLSLTFSTISLGFFEYYLGLLFFIESIFILIFLYISVKFLNLIKRY